MISEKNIFSSDVSNETYGRGYVYSIQYHLVWCTKYRRVVLVGDVEQSVRTYLSDVCAQFNVRILAMEMMPDHVHMLVDCSPQVFVPDLVKVLKGASARKLYLAHPDIKRKLWGGHIWNPSYFVCTVSDRTRELVTNYINGQKIR